MTRQRPGEVRDAIMVALRDSNPDGASISEIEAQVMETLGRPVPASSVRSYLNLNTPGIFERVGRGHYRLRA